MLTFEQLIGDLQLASGNPPVTTQFKPAGPDEEDSRKSVLEEYFEDVTEPQLYELYEAGKHDPWFETGCFAVLNARGAKTTTVVIHYYHTEFYAGNEGNTDVGSTAEFHSRMPLT